MITKQVRFVRHEAKRVERHVKKLAKLTQRLVSAPLQQPMVTSMLRFKSKPVGTIPGTLMHMGEEFTAPPEIDFFQYNETIEIDRQKVTVEEALACADSGMVAWINMEGLHQPELVRRICEHFKIHPLVQEDVLNTQHRPKTEEHEDYLFLIAKMITFNDAKMEIETEQVSFILCRNVVISFQEKPGGDVFGPIRERIKQGKGRIRKGKSDYLLYALLDTIIDHYYLLLEKLGESIEGMEFELLRDPRPESQLSLQKMKADAIMLRKSVWPMREVIAQLERSKEGFFEDATKPYLRDLYDHTVHVMDAIETYRDVVSVLMDTYLSSLSNKMNTVMMTLTLMSAIFLPLTFIAGIYGMNFDNMPELGWKYGYFGVLGAMVVLATVLIILFKKKRWM